MTAESDRIGRVTVWEEDLYHTTLSHPDDIERPPCRGWSASGNGPAVLISVTLNVAESVIATFAGSVGRNPSFFHPLLPLT